MILTDLPTISLLNLRKGSRATDPQHTQRFIQLIAHNLSAQPATHALRFNAHKLLSWTTQPACTLLQSTPLLCSGHARRMSHTPASRQQLLKRHGATVMLTQPLTQFTELTILTAIKGCYGYFLLGAIEL